MVKVYGPMFSMDASGTIAKAATFSKWKGRNYARQRVIPSNPKSTLQVGVRSMFSWLSKSWYLFTAPEKADWDTLAKAASVSPFNAQMGENMANWRQHLAPSTMTPALRTGTLATVTSFVATGGFHQAVLALTLSGFTDNWGAILHRTLTDVAPLTLNTVIGVIDANAIAVFSHTDTGLIAGTYYYWYHLFSRAGKLDTVPIHATAAAVVT
jgi:hypothetical protein